MPIRHHVTKAVVVPAADAAGAATFIGDLDRAATIYLLGTKDSTVQVQVSPDNASWFDEGAAFAGAATGSITLSRFARWVRASVSSYVSGAPTALVIG